MFSAGKVYKVKVETSPGQIVFGRATIIERTGNKIIVKLSTSKETNKILAKGTRIWFINVLPNDMFNGLWASTVVGAQIVGGHTMMVCATPKPEPFIQKRRAPRVALDVPVGVADSHNSATGIPFRSQDISRSGLAIETSTNVKDVFEVGEHVRLRIKTSIGEISLSSRIIRIDRNWFANKTLIGLEFTDVAPAQADSLDRLLVLLGGKPRNPSTGGRDHREITALQKSSLSSSIPSGKSDNSLIRKSNSKENQKTGSSDN